MVADFCRSALELEGNLIGVAETKSRTIYVKSVAVEKKRLFVPYVRNIPRTRYLLVKIRGCDERLLD